MAFIGKITPTRGALIRLRDTLKFIQSGKDILKMKRDRLAGELNRLINELSRRAIVEKELMETYGDLRETLAALGYSTVSLSASSISKIETEVTPLLIMGVAVPRIVVTERPRIESIGNISLYTVAEKFQTLVDELLNLAQIETDIERIAYALMMVNRKVNALEQTIIPMYKEQISNIENLLFDEDLEDFAKIKHIKTVTGRM